MVKTKWVGRAICEPVQAQASVPVWGGLTKLQGRVNKKEHLFQKIFKMTKQSENRQFRTSQSPSSKVLRSCVKLHHSPVSLPRATRPDSRMKTQSRIAQIQCLTNPPNILCSNSHLTFFKLLFHKLIKTLIKIIILFKLLSSTMGKHILCPTGLLS